MSNYQFSKEKNYEKFRKNIEMTKILEPIVAFGHGSIDISTFIKVPDDFIIATFINDGQIMCASEENSKSGYPKCMSSTSRFIYMWQEFLIHTIQLSKFQNKNIIDVIRNTSLDLNDQINLYLKEFTPIYESEIQYSNIFFPGDIISDTIFDFNNDSLNRLGICEFDKFIQERDTLKSAHLPELNFREKHPLSHIYDKFYTKNIYLGQLLDYIIEKISREKIKILFLFSCRVIENTSINNFLSYKPWEPKNPFKDFYKKLDKLSNNESLINFQKKSNSFMNKLQISPTVLYKNFCFGTQDVSSHNTFYYMKNIMCCIDYFDYIDESRTHQLLKYSKVLGLQIALRGMKGEILEMNNVGDKSFYLHDNVVGNVTWSYLQVDAIPSIISNSNYELLWNRQSRIHIFNLWKFKIISFLKPKYTYVFIELMNHLFVYRKYDSSFMKSIDTYNKLYHDLNNHLLFNYRNFEFNLSKYFKDEYKNQLLEIYHKRHFEFSTHIYATPFEFSFVNYRFVDKNNNSIINNFSRKLFSNKNYNSSVYDLNYQLENIAFKQKYKNKNFYGKIHMYLYAYQVLIEKLEYFCITYKLIGKNLKYIMDFYNYNFINYLMNKKRKYVPKYITYLDGIYVISSDYLLTELLS